MLIIGIAGAILTFLGQFYFPAQIYYVAGSALLILTAIHFKLFFFIALEIILFAGHGAILLEIGSRLQFALPTLLCIQLLVFYYLSGQINNAFILIGIAGIALVSIGLAYENQFVFLGGSAAIATFAYYQTRKEPASLIWAILNTMFAVHALLNILRTVTLRGF